MSVVNQHWQVSGPNGSGKTCLLSLITGDHPQCYVNDISVFGFQRRTFQRLYDRYLSYRNSEGSPVEKGPPHDVLDNPKTDRAKQFLRQVKEH